MIVEIIFAIQVTANKIKSSAINRIRTHDLGETKERFYQLSYETTPKEQTYFSDFTGTAMSFEVRTC